MRRTGNRFARVPRAALAAAVVLPFSFTAATVGFGPTTAADAMTGTHLSGPSSAAGNLPASPAMVLDTWGDNSAGELGDGTLTPSLLPTAADTSAAGTATVTAVAAGGRHDLA